MISANERPPSAGGLSEAVSFGRDNGSKNKPLSVETQAQINNLKREYAAICLHEAAVRLNSAAFQLLLGDDEVVDELLNAARVLTKGGYATWDETKRHAAAVSNRILAQACR